LREEQRLRVFENRVLTKVFGPERDEVTEEWRRLHSEELHDVYSSQYYGDQDKEDEMGGACSMNGEDKYIQGIGGET
jgi:hypothetical protein